MTAVEVDAQLGCAFGNVERLSFRDDLSLLLSLLLCVVFVPGQSARIVAQIGGSAKT
jgi:hypothetical protein